MLAWSQISSSGAIVGALFGVGMPGGMQIGYASLVDLTDGRIVFCGPDDEMKFFDSQDGVEIEDADCVAVSFPGFFDLLASLHGTSSWGDPTP